MACVVHAGRGADELRAFKLAAKHLNGEGVRLREDGRASAAVVEANGDRLAQVFINVISNAIKYNNSADPEVRIMSSVRNGIYEVLIEDNGPGIRPDERQLIFSKFMRGSAQARSAASGAGLGLAISRQIMRSFGGTLTLDTAPGPGACFRIALAQCGSVQTDAGHRSANA